MPSPRRNGRRRPTIEDVARAASVSTGAVSYAFNGRPGVADETRVRIMSAARDLGWRPSASARALVHSRSRAVGLVMSRPAALLESDPFFVRFLAGVETALAEIDYALLLQVVESGEAREHECYERLAAAHRVDGVFLTDMRLNDPRFGLLRELGLATVGVGQPVGDVDFPWIGVDDAQGVAQIVAHLLELGHERLAYVGGPPGYVHSIHRERGWREELAVAGLTGPAEVGDFSEAGGARATYRLLRSARRPTAIVYANDLMAVAGMAVARELDIRVPGHLSIASFDDIPLAAYVSPQLTTVRADVPAWGREAAKLLVAEIEQRVDGAPPLGPVELIVRASTGPPP
ncbi:MAG: LacI family transcriptional regulator [Candidatus Dormibacteraeota bacterium]|nr:LacI family transcriptional regulator [Candidatus Dormibacteraeota bacterium]